MVTKKREGRTHARTRLLALNWHFGGKKDENISVWVREYNWIETFYASMIGLHELQPEGSSSKFAGYLPKRPLRVRIVSN